MADQFIGEIRIFPFNFAPYGWAFCNGQLVPISQNTALFALLGTNFGGNGTSTFGLPNLQGCVPVDFGQGTGLSYRNLGETGGEQQVSLQLSQLPGHTHAFQATTTRANTNTPDSQTSLAHSDPIFIYTQAAGNPALSQLAAGAVGKSPVGGFPHDNMMPYLTLNFCIALTGLFPARG
jgi:microcystin-dependent protein